MNAPDQHPRDSNRFWSDGHAQLTRPDVHEVPLDREMVAEKQTKGGTWATLVSRLLMGFEQLGSPARGTSLGLRPT
jgi:hypothetical protein